MHRSVTSPQISTLALQKSLPCQGPDATTTSHRRHHFLDSPAMPTDSLGPEDVPFQPFSTAPVFGSPSLLEPVSPFSHVRLIGAELL